MALPEQESLLESELLSLRCTANAVPELPNHPRLNELKEIPLSGPIGMYVPSENPLSWHIKVEKVFP